MTDTAWGVVIILAAHFIGDWYLQPRDMARDKSKHLYMLLGHLLIVSIVLTIGLAIASTCGVWNEPKHYGYLVLLNAAIHGIIDWNIWGGYATRVKYRIAAANNYGPADDRARRCAKDLEDFKYWEDKGFYNTIATDQFLHLTTLAWLFL